MKNQANFNHPKPLSADPYLRDYQEILQERAERFLFHKKKLCKRRSLAEVTALHCQKFLLQHKQREWLMREWAPNAEKIYLLGDCNNFQELESYRFESTADGCWELRLPQAIFRHGMHYVLKVYWPGGSGIRIPSFANYVVQDENTKLFSAVVYDPETTYVWKNPVPERKKEDPLLIYEAHIGMAQEEGKVGTFREFREKILPRIAKSGYNTLQLMAIMSHPYYGSFGYHVANFFSISSRFGTPDDFRELVDAAHGAGIRVIMDLVHSHAVRNEAEGLARFDGTIWQYFHDGNRGIHQAWDSYCFDYGKPEVRQFLLANLNFFLTEYNLDGFRFDGVTSMLYRHHGLNCVFTGYPDYFSSEVDEDALLYLALANAVIHDIKPDAITIAEDVSGMPGLASAPEEGGCGFDYRMAMGVSDLWFKLFDRKDEDWNIGNLYYELTNRRQDERSISYVECHDQALVGGQSAIFRLIGEEMYHKMSVFSPSIGVDRGISLHKLSRLATLSSAGHGYLNFMGNEFGHPEWIDFPREGNQWSYHYARRQWSLADSPHLRYQHLGNFDQAMLKLFRKGNFFTEPVQLLRADQDAKILIYHRGNWFFCFNFDPERSRTDYEIPVLPGSYQLVLDSDRQEFGGQDRIVPNQRYFARTRQIHCEQLSTIMLYLPCRTALVLYREN